MHVFQLLFFTEHDGVFRRLDLAEYGNYGQLSTGSTELKGSTEMIPLIDLQSGISLTLDATEVSLGIAG